MSRSVDQLLETIAGGGAGWVRAAAKLMSAVENDSNRVHELAPHVARAPQPRMMLGVTGAPGAGKSTLIDAMIHDLRRRRPADRLGIISVDPSSPYTQGAVLGDRVRMMRHAEDPNVFVRSLASRGHLGGLAAGVRGVMQVMRLIGAQTILIETVGVGQSEVEIAGVADLVAVVLSPGMGDEVQLLKAGLLEAADLLVVNKADRPGADELFAQLLASSRDDRGPPVCRVSATKGTGVAEFVDALDALADARQSDWQERRDAAVREGVRDAIRNRADRRLRELLSDAHGENRLVAQVLSGEKSVDQITRELIRQTGEESS